MRSWDTECSFKVVDKANDIKTKTFFTFHRKRVQIGYQQCKRGPSSHLHQSASTSSSLQRPCLFKFLSLISPSFLFCYRSINLHMMLLQHRGSLWANLSMILLVWVSQAIAFTPSLVQHQTKHHQSTRTSIYIATSRRSLGLWAAPTTAATAEGNTGDGLLKVKCKATSHLSLSTPYYIIIRQPSSSLLHECR